MDITTAIMTAVCKYISFGFQVSDGYLDASKLTKDQNKRKIEQLPSFWEYFGFIHFFGSCVMGPFFDYYDYRLYVHNKAEFTRIPSTVLETFKQLFVGLFFIFAFSGLSAVIRMDETTKHSFKYHSILYRIIYSALAMKVVSLNYFGGKSTCFPPAHPPLQHRQLSFSDLPP